VPVRLFRRARRRMRVCLCLVLAIPAVLLSPPSASAQEGPPVYEPPVAAPVSDGFRAPATPYGPGNRGLEFATAPGDPVRASADGQVVFAGAVGGSLHVTVLHADGIRTSYSKLQHIDVHTGQTVHRGDQVGKAGRGFHLGARRAGTYIDPAGLFAGVATRVELLPLEVPPGAPPAAARDALGDHVWDDRAGGGIGTGLLGDLTQVLAARARLTQHYMVDVNAVARALRAAGDLTERLVAPPPCSDEAPPVRPVAGQQRRAVLVGGLGSSGESASIDDLRLADLGYADAAAERFSYAGGGGDYGSTDTQGDLQESARLLADHIETTARASPHATVDVFAHSMGGVVAHLALLELDRRGFDLDRLGVVTTLGSPHHGADLATAVAAANTTLTGNVGLDLAEEVLGTGLDPDARAVAQLSETSDVVRVLDESDLPAGVEMVSIAASGDLVVASPNTQVDGARNVTVGLTGRDAHSDLVGDEETTAEIARALAGRPQACEPLDEVVNEQMLGHGISYLEDVAGFTALSGAR